MVKKISIKRYESLHAKLLDKGISADEAMNYTPKQWFKVGLSTKKLRKDRLEGAKRLLRQINDNQKDVVDYYVKKRKITNSKYVRFLEKETERLYENLEEERGYYKIRKIKGKYNKVVVKYGIKEKTNIFYIKSTNSKDYKRQLDIIRNKYGVVKIYKPKRVKYKQFVNLEKFAEFVES